MKTKYSPQPVPSKASDPLVGYVYRELHNIGIQMRLPLTLEERFAAPNKPVDGQVEFADGTTWNPGGGKGIYAYYSSAWNKLG